MVQNFPGSHLGCSTVLGCLVHICTWLTGYPAWLGFLTRRLGESHWTLLRAPLQMQCFVIKPEAVCPVQLSRTQGPYLGVSSSPEWSMPVLLLSVKSCTSFSTANIDTAGESPKFPQLFNVAQPMHRPTVDVSLPIQESWISLGLMGTFCYTRRKVIDNVFKKLIFKLANDYVPGYFKIKYPRNVMLRCEFLKSASSF